MELVEFVQTSLVTVTSLLPFTMALVTFWGKLGVTGKWQFVSSLATGLVLGGWFMYIQTEPVTLLGWTQVVFVGLVEGLAASGVYEVGRNIVEKADKPAEG